MWLKMINVTVGSHQISRFGQNCSNWYILFSENSVWNETSNTSFISTEISKLEREAKEEARIAKAHMQSAAKFRKEGDKLGKH